MSWRDKISNVQVNGSGNIGVQNNYYGRQKRDLQAEFEVIDERYYNDDGSEKMVEHPCYGQQSFLGKIIDKIIGHKEEISLKRLEEIEAYVQEEQYSIEEPSKISNNNKKLGSDIRDLYREKVNAVEDTLAVKRLSKSYDELRGKPRYTNRCKYDRDIVDVEVVDHEELNRLMQIPHQMLENAEKRRLSRDIYSHAIDERESWRKR